MSAASRSRLAAIPSIESLLSRADLDSLGAAHGRELVRDCLREATGSMRERLARESGPGSQPPAAGAIADALAADACERVEALVTPRLRRVVNLTGTVLHTNLGRAPLPPEAVRAIGEAAASVNLEMDLDSGRRGDRDSHVEDWLCRLTGAEAATVVNNNAAAVLLALNSLANRKQVPVSRGELVEIGGAFRIPDVMTRAGCKLVEVGTTNRTHLRDFESAIGPRTGALMKVHTSNYVVQGFTAEVAERDLAALAHANELPFITDLGSGSLVDLTALGLPREPTPMAAIADGCDVVTFSGDKLLGGPQCGIIVGSARALRRIRRNPMKRALRCDKLILAALGAILTLYSDPEQVARRVPALRMLTRTREAMLAQACRLSAAVQDALGDEVEVEVVTCDSQVGSGALPTTRLASAGLALRPRRRSGRAANRLAARLRALPVPVVARIEDDVVVLDLRCLEQDSDLLGPLATLGAG